jgi:hypothetical protein
MKSWRTLRFIEHDVKAPYSQVELASEFGELNGSKVFGK